MFEVKVHVQLVDDPTVRGLLRGSFCVDAETTDEAFVLAQDSSEYIDTYYSLGSSVIVLYDESGWVKFVIPKDRAATSVFITNLFLHEIHQSISNE